MTQKTFDFSPLDRDKAISELIEFAIWKGDLIKLADGQYYWKKDNEYLGERTKTFVTIHYCPECGKSDAEHPVRGHGLFDKDCDMVYGRRGWRQLGVYDG